VAKAKKSPKNAAPPPTGKKYEKVAMPPVSSVEGLEEIAMQIYLLKIREKAIKEELEAYTTAAVALMGEINPLESWSVRADDGDSWTLTYMKAGKKETLVKEKLIEAGVTLKQLAKGTKITDTNPYVVLRVGKEE
jgi:hypothetical protein